MKDNKGEFMTLWHKRQPNDDCLKLYLNKFVYFEEDVKEALKNVIDMVEKQKLFYENLLEEKKFEIGSIYSIRILIIIEDHNKILTKLKSEFGEEMLK